MIDERMERMGYMKNRLLDLAQRRVNLEYGYEQMSPTDQEAAAIEVSQIKEMVAMYKAAIRAGEL